MGGRNRVFIPLNRVYEARFGHEMALDRQGHAPLQQSASSYHSGRSTSNMAGITGSKSARDDVLVCQDRVLEALSP